MVSWLPTFIRKRVSQAQAKSGCRAGLIQKPRAKAFSWNGGRADSGSTGSFRWNRYGKTDSTRAAAQSQYPTM